MTPTQDLLHLRALAEAATPGPHHIYTNPRDDNNWANNGIWHAACQPQTVIAMLDALDALQAENERLTTLSKGQHVELYNARLQRAELQAVFDNAHEVIKGLGAEVVKAAGASPQPSVGQQIEDGLKAIAKRFGHDYWYAGQEGCPPELKAANGELHTLRCKRCGQDKPDSKWCAGASPVEPIQAETMTLQEVWAAAGGNPGIHPTKADVVEALQMLDAICDMTDVQPSQADRADVDDLESEILALKAALAVHKERAIVQPSQARERCCYHDSDCAVHNMPAYPAGPCDCSKKDSGWWAVTGKYERQAFASLSAAEAYCKGLNTTFPEGGYVVKPLFEQPSQALELSADDVRAAGGIVHGDGNIFFTNIGKLNAAINAKGA